MFLDKYLTEYDDGVGEESYIDPLGMLIIWSSYGEAIFNKRVNSIANDVRNYTLCIFNHYLVKSFIQDETIKLGKGLAGIYVRKDNLAFKHACLLYLENLFVYSILRHEDAMEVDSVGVLGISVGRRRWHEADRNPTLIFTDKDEHQILKRQIGLGVSGRYKTPMLEIGYFDGSYSYHLPSAQSLWEELARFIQGTSQLQSLAVLLLGHLKDLLSRDEKHPELHFDDIPKKLSSAFIKAFSSSRAVGGYARDYWLSVTGLDTGASGRLLHVLDENFGGDQLEDITPQKLIQLADKTDLPHEEHRKLEQIELLEPFLSDTMLLFTLLTCKNAQPLSEVIQRWEKFGRDDTRLSGQAQHLIQDAELMAVVQGEARWRLQSLLKFADSKTLSEQITLLVNYHQQVMSGRGRQPWLTIADNMVKVHVRPLPNPSEDQWQSGVWYNDYYLPQFISLVRGYQG